MYPKRLIEVDLPIKQISAHARREKSIRRGHISTLHIWWARRPLAACRAVLCAALWIDPADDLCPPEFRQIAWGLMLEFARKAMTKASLASEYSFGRYKGLVQAVDEGIEFETNNPNHLLSLRHTLLMFIADFANWDNSTISEYLETARALTQAAHEALGGMPGTRPMVVDPFAGGGAIPLEALRVGADAYASDLNPVAVLLNKVVLEYIPRYGQQLADEVRKWGNEIKKQAEEELAEFYPKDEDGATPIAYLWARTVISDAPLEPGEIYPIEIPLMRSLWLAKKGNKSVALRWVRDASGKVQTETINVTYADGTTRTVRRPLMEIFTPKKANEVPEGTVKRGNATCPVTGVVTTVESVRRQLKTRRGGAADARLFVIVTTKNDQQGRFYRLPTPKDLEVTALAQAELEARIAAHTGELSLVPNEPTPIGGGSGAGRAFSQRNYGMDVFADLFTPRQLLALTTLARLVSEVERKLATAHENGLAVAIQTCLAMAIDRQADYLTSLTIWANSGEFIAHTFGRQAIPIVWEFPECQLWADGSGNWEGAINWIVLSIEALSSLSGIWGQAYQSSAVQSSLPDDSVHSLFTDPPYYDAVPYSDLSDFFLVWLKRTAGSKYPDLLNTLLAPKDEECIVDEVKGKDKAFFERTMGQAMTEGRRVLAPNGIGVVVFAHKSTSGWEAQLQAMVDAGWVITGSWAIDTERPGRLRAQGSAALASSVHIVCRPRENEFGELQQNIGDWREVLSELPRRIHMWLPRLEQEGIVGADALFACIGPAMEIFSRYARVEKASGEVVTLREYLEQVWGAISQEALQVIFEGSDTSGFEADARLTAIWFWVLKTSANGNNGNHDEEEPSFDEEDEVTESPKKNGAGYSMEYDAARKLAQAFGVNLTQLSQGGGIIQVSGNIATLTSVSKREFHLIGQQLSLFGENSYIYDGSQGRRKDPKATMRSVSGRQLELWDEKETPAPDPNQPFLIAPEPDMRTIIEKLKDGGETLLDRLHQAMLLHWRGQTALLGMFLNETGVGTDVRFWRLADALSRLYPVDSDEKRWVDGVLARKKGLGF